ncbi:MAG: hypothetical protein U0525_04590 [Patescibacteria group bacterium]
MPGEIAHWYKVVLSSTNFQISKTEIESIHWLTKEDIEKEEKTASDKELPP